MDTLRLRAAGFVVVAIAVSALFVGGTYYAFAEIMPDTPRISNVWPFSVIEKLSGDRTFTHAVPPLFTRNKRPDTDRRTLRPLVTSVKDHAEQTVTVDFLPPLGHASSSPDDKLFSFFPLVSHRKWKDNAGQDHQFTSIFPIYHRKVDGTANHTAVFPIYMKGTAGSVSYPIPFKSTGDYQAFFPFYGSLPGVFGNDRVTFAFWPLYTRLEKTYPMVDGSRGTFVKHQFLWPFFTVGSGGGYKSLKVWPIYGHTIKEGQYASRFFLWPIFNVTRNLGTDTNQARDITAGLPLYWNIQEGQKHAHSLFPFYGRRITPDMERSFRMWPLYINTKYTKDGFQTQDYLWPVFSKTEGSVKGFKLWPLFGVRKRQETTARGSSEDVSTFYLWTLGRYERSKRPDSTRTYNRLFPLFAIGRYDDVSGYKQRQVFLWPLVSYQEDNLQGAKSLSFPNLLGSFESQFPMIQEVYSPLWRIIDYARQGDESRLSLLWNFVDIRRDAHTVAMSVGPFLTLRKNADGVQEYTLLSSFHIKNRGSIPYPKKAQELAGEPTNVAARPVPCRFPTIYSPEFAQHVSDAWNECTGWLKRVGSNIHGSLTGKR